MKRVSKYLLSVSIGIATLTSSCISASTEDVDNAETALEQNKPEKASEICTDILEEQVSAPEKDVDLLCRLSILYMKIADEVEASENIGYAVQCFHLAYNTDSTTVNKFFNSIPVEDMAHSAMLKQIVRSTNQYSPDSVVNIEETFIDEPDSTSFSYDSIQ